MVVRKYIYVMIFGLIIFADLSSSFASNDFFNQQYRGWLWFEEKEKEEEDINSKINKMPSKEEMMEAKRQNEEFSQDLELLRHLAIRYPDNLEYAKLYKMKEKELLDNATIFASTWQMVNMLNPEIVDELSNPANLYGRKIFKEEKKKKEQGILRELAKNTEVFVFRMEGCPYCGSLEKHLSYFARLYGFEVEAISADTGKSDYFVTHQSPEMIAAFNLEVMPVVMIVDSRTRQRFELARGAVSVADLEEKALLVAKYLSQQEQEGGND